MVTRGMRSMVDRADYQWLREAGAGVSIVCSSSPYRLPPLLSANTGYGAISRKALPIPLNAAGPEPFEHNPRDRRRARWTYAADDSHRNLGQWLFQITHATPTNTPFPGNQACALVDPLDILSFRTDGLLQDARVHRPSVDHLRRRHNAARGDRRLCGLANVVGRKSSFDRQNHG